MKRKFISILTTALLLTGTVLLPVTAQETEPHQKLTLNEVAHSIFYAPQYAAIELGYFEEEGIDLTLVNGFGAIILVQNILKPRLFSGVVFCS